MLKDTTSWINTNLFFYFLEDGSVGGRDGDTLSCWPIRSYPAGDSTGKSSERSNIYQFWTRQHLSVVNAATFISFERGKSYQLWTRQHLSVLNAARVISCEQTTFISCVAAKFISCERGNIYQFWTRQELSVVNAATFISFTFKRVNISVLKAATFISSFMNRSRPLCTLQIAADFW